MSAEDADNGSSAQNMTVLPDGAKPDAPQSAEEQGPLEGQALVDAIVKQVDYYFSRENLASDAYLVAQMNAELYVDISIIANFKKMKALTQDLDFLVQCLREGSSNVEVSPEGTHLKPKFSLQRNTLILRNIPSNLPNEDVEALFDTEHCAPIVSLRSEFGDNWFVTFETQEDAERSLEYIRTATYNETPIQARLKSENLLRGILPTMSEEGGAQGAAGYYYQNYYPGYPANGAYQSWPNSPMGMPYWDGQQPYDPSMARAFDSFKANARFRNRNGKKDGQFYRKDRSFGGEGKRKGRKGMLKNKEQDEVKEKPEKQQEFQLGSTLFPPLPSQDGENGQIQQQTTDETGTASGEDVSEKSEKDSDKNSGFKAALTRAGPSPTKAVAPAPVPAPAPATATAAPAASEKPSEEDAPQQQAGTSDTTTVATPAAPATPTEATPLSPEKLANPWFNKKTEGTDNPWTADRKLIPVESKLPPPARKESKKDKEKKNRQDDDLHSPNRKDKRSPQKSSRRDKENRNRQRHPRHDEEKHHHHHQAENNSQHEERIEEKVAQEPLQDPSVKTWASLLKHAA